MTHLTVEGIFDFLRHNPQAKVLDVCSTHEHETRTWMRSINLIVWYAENSEINSGFIEQVSQQIARDDYVLVICHSGYRSAEAAILLEKNGFKHVYNLLGGHKELLKTRSRHINYSLTAGC
ncbi:MAG: hypothetical protein HXY27_05810 [Hydrogenophilaceae bacterium]|nr:hypothetical protein [Hydrogenophilaceae bacterium]